MAKFRPRFATPAYTDRNVPLSPDRAIRGTICWYSFPEVPDFKGEICKTRQVVLLSDVAQQRLKRNLDIPVLPLSSSTSRAGGHTLRTKLSSYEAMTTMVTSVNSQKLNDYVGQLLPTDLETAEWGIWRHLRPGPSISESMTYRPGTVFEIPWENPKGNGTRAFAIIGNMELTA